MGKIETVMKSEIVRLAKRQLQGTYVPLARDVRSLKRTASQLRRTVAALNRIAAEWVSQSTAQKAVLQAPEEEVKTARFSPARIRKLRLRLGLTQEEMALLIGVSSIAVWAWESGRSRPSGASRAALVALRKLKKREVRKVLDQKRAAQPTPKPAAKKKGRKVRKTGKVRKARGRRRTR